MTEHRKRLTTLIRLFHDAQIPVSLFIDPGPGSNPRRAQSGRRCRRTAHRKNMPTATTPSDPERSRSPSAGSTPRPAIRAGGECRPWADVSQYRPPDGNHRNRGIQHRAQYYFPRGSRRPRTSRQRNEILDPFIASPLGARRVRAWFVMKIVTAHQMRELDRRTIQEAGVPGTTLMERAGSGVVSAWKKPSAP